MGFLVDASPLDWEDSLEVVKYVRQHGIEQFIRHYRRVEAIEGDMLRWGDELEYGIFKIDEQGHSVRLSLRAPEIMKQLRQREEAAGDSAGQSCAWMPEFGSWMVEGTPGQPYSGFAADLLLVERNMRIRRARLLAALAADEICPTVTVFPLMGVGSCSHPPADPKPGLSESLFVPDEVINPAPRFGALVANIRRRRGSKVDIRMPRFADEKTPAFERHAGCPPPETRAEALQMEEVYMDAMAFGMGCCCLQVTFQTRNVAESRHLFDQLAVLAPVMLALTAATPIARGVLLDTDVRWDIIAQSVDDRTPAERGMDDGAARHPEMAGGGVKRLPKSRYDSISSFICDHLGGKDEQTRTERYNDVDAPIDEEALQTLLDAGVDAVLARHLAHLFTRDPLVVYRERIELDDATETDHFENIQSTNWQTVRWKPPPAKSDSHIGWRTEFRSMEVQLTDYENAAFTTFVVLVSRVILYFNLNLYTPISCVDENMRRAHARDAVRTQRFHFQQRSMPPAAGQSDDGEPEPGPPAGQGGDMDSKRDSRASASCGRTAGVEELSLYEVMVGRGEFKGLVPMVLTYLELIETDSATMSSLSGYLDFIVARASGRLHTPARWMRDFVCSHPDYRQDSVVSERIAADLLAKCHRIGLGVEAAPALLGDVVIPEVRAKDAYAAADMGDSHRLSRISRSIAELMASHQFRYQLQERRTRLQASEADLRKKWEKTRHELEEVEAQIAFLSPK